MLTRSSDNKYDVNIEIWLLSDEHLHVNKAPRNKSILTSSVLSYFDRKYPVRLTHTHTLIHTHTHTHIHTNTHTHKHIYTFIHTYIYTHSHIRIEGTTKRNLQNCGYS